MSFFKNKKAPAGAIEKAKKTRIVSFRLEDPDYRIFIERVKASGRKQSDYGRRALLHAKVVGIATPKTWPFFVRSGAWLAVSTSSQRRQMAPDSSWSSGSLKLNATS